MGKYDVMDIANWFLKYDRYMEVSKGSDGITNLKLQKLLYYAQGASLATNGVPLFDEPIKAWEHGPVVVKVYHAFKKHGSFPIPPNDDFDATVIDKETASLLEDVYNTFGQFSAWKLRDMTHNETPWKKTQPNGTIPQDEIKRYFAENYME